MENKIKDRIIITCFIICGITFFFSTMVGAMYLAQGINDKIQKTFIQGK